MISQDEFEIKKFNKFSIGFQVFHVSRLIDNAIFCNKNNQLSTDYNSMFKNVNLEPNSHFDESPRSLMDLSESMILGNINFGYNINKNSFLSLIVEFCYKNNNLVTLSTIQGYDNPGGPILSYGDLMLNLIYFRDIYNYKKLSIKGGFGGGFVLSPVDKYSTLFNKGIFTDLIYNDQKAYSLQTSNYVLTTKENYRSEIQLNISPRLNIEYNITDKHKISLVSGLNILPFNYIGVNAKVIDTLNSKIINESNFNFNHINLFIGFGYNFSWGK